MLFGKKATDGEELEMGEEQADKQAIGAVSAGDSAGGLESTQSADFGSSADSRPARTQTPRTVQGTDFGSIDNIAPAPAKSVDAVGSVPKSVSIESDDFAEEDALDAPAEELIAFIQESPSPFHAVAAIRKRLDAAGFAYVPENAAWNVKPGGRYYTQRNGSSVVAWSVGDQVGRAKRGLQLARAKSTGVPYSFKLTASHSDSPTFKLKSACELDNQDGYLRLDTEAYGGMIDYTWFDRPLSLAGRVLVRDGSRIESRLVALNRDVALIPSLAIHMNRSVNDGFSPNRASDLLPIISAGDLSAGSLNVILADALDIDPSQIVSHELVLVNRQNPCVWGATNEFVSSPKLDDLMCAFTSLKAFLAHATAPMKPGRAFSKTNQTSNDIAVYACFDNEEVGSETKQGAASTFLYDVLSRVNASLGYTDEDLRRAFAASMLVSCDNAHAVHPAHPDLADSLNRPRMNGGLVIKEAANQHYCTDALSRAALMSVLDDAGVPYQSFANRSDMAGGSTLGNISNMQVSVHAVDVGCAQLAMHSSYETAGARDVEHAIEAFTAFYNADIRIDGADAIMLG
ncbi:M18 family aminopeptidase [Collinsella provencensis]|uniref:M18 family aminopeptidase n=1 Tax=Collinsella provencensis TaxID=1937461 RepID=UPI001F2B4D8F|nr:M18 family aminopeptidase [Collinsella provencensis]